MAAAIDLDEHALTGHALATAAMAWRAAATGALDPGRAEDAPDAGPGQADALPLGEQLGEVDVVGAAIGSARGERDHAPPEVPVDASWACSTTVAVGQGSGSLGKEAGTQPPDVADRHTEQPRRLVDGQVSSHQVGQDTGATLFFGRQADRVSHVGRLTKSLNR